MYRKFPTMLLAFLLPINYAYADCASPVAIAGTMDYFDAPDNSFKFCDGTNWVSIKSYNLVPAGAIMAFNLTACPAGWTEFTQARGRFLRGIDNGAGNDPSGTRAPGNVQADALTAHNHTITAVDVSNTTAFQINDNTGDYIVATDNAVLSGGGTNTVIRNSRYATQNAGSTETRPKNVAVLYCVKN